MSLQGKAELKARLKAIGQSFKPMGRDWADEYVVVARPRVPVRTGRLRRSIRRKSATATRATVVAHYTAYFIDAGVRRHSIAKGARLRKATIFTSKQHPGFRARPFRARSAHEALRRKPMSLTMIREWNRAKGRRR